MQASSDRGEIRVLPDSVALHRAAAEEIVRVATETLRRRKVVTIAIPGGPSFKGLSALLGGEGDPGFRKLLPWPQLHFFWTDELPVPADHPASNYRAAREGFVGKVALTRKQVHRMRTEGLNAQQAAREHERELRQFFADHLMLRAEVPRFDLVLLVVEADHHVAGIWPGSRVLGERRTLVSVGGDPSGENPRMTLTPTVFNMAAEVLFLASGKDSAGAVEAGLRSPLDPSRFPAHAIRPEEGRMLWFIDRDAAAGLG